MSQGYALLLHLSNCIQSHRLDVFYNVGFNPAKEHLTKSSAVGTKHYKLNFYPRPEGRGNVNKICSDKNIVC